MSRATRLALGLLVVLAGPARAHDALHAARAQHVLASVARHHTAARSGSGDGAAEALFALGESTEELVDLMNQDLRDHGETNLFAQAVVRRLEAYDVHVALVAATRAYAYDLAAFQEYLRRAPAGPRAADARFKLIARTFQASMGADPSRLVGTDVRGLLRAMAVEETFLREHPAQERARDVRFFLAVDYYRAARNLTDAVLAREYAGRARRELDRVVTSAPGSVEARAAAALLETLDAAAR